MAYRDIKNAIDTAKQEGKNEKALEIAKNMLADGVDINLIKKYSGQTQEQIEKIKRRWQICTRYYVCLLYTSTYFGVNYFLTGMHSYA